MLPHYDLNKIKFATDEATFRRGVGLYDSGKVTEVEEAFGNYTAVVQGTKPYRVSVSGRRYKDIVGEIRHLNEAIAKIDGQIKDRGRKLKGYKNVTSITGIGDLSGTILLNAIGDVKYFQDEKALAGYFGIVSRIRASNETVHLGRITKMGNKIARTALVQSTLIAIWYSPYLRAFYDRLKAKKGSGKAIIATARKLLGIVYNTLKNDWIFEDFGNYKLAPGCL